MTLTSNGKIFGLRFIQETEDYEYGHKIMHIVYEVFYDNEMTKEQLTESKIIFDNIQYMEHYRFYYYTECTTTEKQELFDNTYIMCWMPITKEKLEELFI